MTGNGNGRGQSRVPYPTSMAGRVLSFVLAVVLTVLVLLYPRAIAESAGQFRHALLVLTMWGTAIGFIHGVGFEPRLAVWRLLFHPVLGWLLMLGGIALVLSA